MIHHALYLMSVILHIFKEPIDSNSTAFIIKMIHANLNSNKAYFVIHKRYSNNLGRKSIKLLKIIKINQTYSQGKRKKLILKK
jgi:hypothetical protein